MAIVYRYTARFPVINDASRPAWPASVFNRFNGLADVVDLSFGEDVAAWTRPRAEDVRIESRRPAIEVVTYSADAAAAETARVALFDELERLRVALGEDLIIVRETVEAFILPITSVIGGPTRSGT